MDMQQSAMNDGQTLFGQATSFIALNSCNICPTFAQSLPAAPGSQSLTVERRHVLPAVTPALTISSAFRIK
jgi:hypothetical protein